MDKWTTPNDSPIWRSLNESYPHLTPETKQQVFQFLQEARIPPTDKIFPWVVETMVNRVSMNVLQAELEMSRGKIQTLPEIVGQSVGRSLMEPIQKIQANQATVENLTVELRKNSVIEASLRQSGWRGVICAFEAIAQHKMLGLTVGGIALLSALLAGAIAWKLSEGDRQIINVNQQAIEECYEKFAVDKDRNGWFSCSGIQLPMQ